MHRLGLMLIVISLAACVDTPAVLPPAATQVPGPNIPTTTVPDPDASVPDSADMCDDGDTMVADGRLIESQTLTPDAVRISGISWRTTGSCHTITITFTTADGAPATTPPSVAARLLRDASIIRIETDATDSVVEDQVVEHGPLDRLFVPIDDDQHRFIDLVLADAVIARASVFSSPARLVLELQTGGPPLIGRPLIDPRVVIVTPTAVATPASVLDVSGYVRGDEIDLSLDVMFSQRVIRTEIIDVSGPPGRWRAFSAAIPVGDTYDGLQVRDGEGTVVAGIPIAP